MFTSTKFYKDFKTEITRKGIHILGANIKKVLIKGGGTKYGVYTN